MQISVCKMYHQLFFITFYHRFHIAMHHIFSDAFSHYNSLQYKYYTTTYLLQRMIQTVYTDCFKVTFFNALCHTFHTLQSTLRSKKHSLQLFRFIYNHANGKSFNRFHTFLRLEFKSIFMNNMLYNLHQYIYPLDHNSFQALFHGIFHKSFLSAYSISFSIIFSKLKKKKTMQCIKDACKQ
jgi:hypothetical protein